MLERMTDGISDQSAIQAALSGDWKTAIRINELLIKDDKKNIDLLNRLGFAYLKNGELTKAKKTFDRVIKIDPYNQIAVSNLKKLTSVRKKDVQGFAGDSILSPALFLEEPGVTKIISCINIAPSQTIVALCPGQKVYLKPKNHTIEVRTSDNVYCAALPDDIAFKLIKLIGAGYMYDAIIKTTSKNIFCIMVREISRAKRFKLQPSFIASTSSALVSTTRDGDGADRPDMTITGEEDDSADSEE